MNPTPRKMTEEDKDLVAEYLAKGGEVTVGKYGEVSENIEYTGGFYQRRKKKKEEGKEEE